MNAAPHVPYQHVILPDGRTGVLYAYSDGGKFAHILLDEQYRQRWRDVVVIVEADSLPIQLSLWSDEL